MSQEIIHVYLMPGLAANPSIFENIKLPEDQFKIHWMSWILPDLKEDISTYALRMTGQIKHKNVVLIGVSFGGIMVQEISRHIKLRKLIIVSSVKTKFELPRRMRLARLTKVYKLAPTRLAKSVDALAKYSFGRTVKKRVELYKKYLSISDKRYLDWAIEQVVCWNQDLPLNDILHIHGENDRVFPIKYVRNCIKVKAGSHIMIINKYRWFNENLPKLILC